MSGKSFVETIAAQLVSVQPMPSDTFKKLYEGSKSTQELIDDGYEPVSKIGLLWVKEDSSSE